MCISNRRDRTIQNKSFYIIRRRGKFQGGSFISLWKKLKICSRPSKHLFHILLPLHISCPGGCAALQVCTQLASAFPPHRELCGTRLCIPEWKAELILLCSSNIFFFFFFETVLLSDGNISNDIHVPPSGAYTEYLVSNQLIMPLFPCCR